MKRLTVLLTVAVFLVAASASAQVGAAGKGTPRPKPRTTFTDNFNNGRMDGWVVDYGNWVVQDGALVESPVDASDWKLILVDNLNTASQTIEVMVNPKHDGGNVSFWHLNWANQVEVGISYYYQTIAIGECHDTIGKVVWIRREVLPDAWYKLRIEADSVTGDVAVYVDDVYVYTYTVETPHRSGKVGFHSGSHGSAWDDFRVRPLHK